MKHKLFFNKLWLRVGMLVAIMTTALSGTAWAEENDTHDFAQTVQQLLNNNASISSINIDAQSYSVKKVVVSYRYNKTLTDAVTVEVTVNGTSWGTQNVEGTGNNYSTLEFTGDAETGAIEISFTNNTGNGTGHGTFYVNNVQLVEGASAAPLTPYTVTFSDGGSVTETTGGAGVTLPSRNAIGSYTFAGWSTANVETETTTAPTTIIPAGAYQPTGNITLYPVYTKTEGGGTVNNTASVTISDYATANSWNNSIQYSNVSLDAKVTASAAGGGNTGKYYTSGNEWRFYQNESPTLTISTSNGTLTSITITYNISNTGILKFNNSNITSGTTVKVSGTSAEFTVGNTSTATNGQVKITAIEVNYSASGSTTYYWSSPVAATVEQPVITVAENPFLFSTTATITCATEGATIKYSYDGETWSDYSSALTITETKTIYAKAIKGEDESTVTSITATKNLATPIVTVSGDLTLDLDGETNVSAGTLTAAVTYENAAVPSATVTWSGNNNAVATIDASTGAVTLLTTGTVTFTATYAGNSDYAEETGTKTVTIVDSNAPGTTQQNPYTVAQALTAIQALPNNNATSEKYYVSGIVSAFYGEATGITSASSHRYYISDDGTTTNQLLVYNGKGLNNVTFSSDEDLKVGDEVIIYGAIQNYQGNTPEIASGNYIVSLSREKVDPTIPSSNVSVAYGSTYTVDDSVIEGGEITVTSSNTAVATVSGLVITPVAVGTTTITVATAENTSYNAGSETFTLTVTAPEGQTTAPTGSAGDTIFEETFDGFVKNSSNATTQGGNSNGQGTGNDIWSGNAGATSFSTVSDDCDESDWNVTHGGAGYKCAKFGSGSSAGSATTRSITATVGTTYTLTFKAAPWNQESTTMNVTAEGATISGISDATMTVEQWNDFSATVTATASSFTLTFAASQKRFFLDEVKIEAPASGAPTETYTIPSSGLGTYCSQYPIDLDELPEGVKAYAVTAKGESSVTLTEITGTIKGGVGFILEGTGNTDVTFTFADSSTKPTNLLVGTLAPKYLAAGTAYGLKSGVFQPNTAGTIKAHRAYLPADAGNAVKALTLIFEDDATGITHTRVITDEATIYDLTGRRLSQMQKGINIVNGKKILY